MRKLYLLAYLGIAAMAPALVMLLVFIAQSVVPQ